MASTYANSSMRRDHQACEARHEVAVATHAGRLRQCPCGAMSLRPASLLRCASAPQGAKHGWASRSTEFTDQLRPILSPASRVASPSIRSEGCVPRAARTTMGRSGLHTNQTARSMTVKFLNQTRAAASFVLLAMAGQNADAAIQIELELAGLPSKLSDLSAELDCR